QQLLASAPIVIAPPIASVVGAQHAAPHLGTADHDQSVAPGGASPDQVGSPASSMSAPDAASDATLKGGATAAPTEHAPLTLASIPVDALLDDHSVEFEECKRWSNSEAGQAARMTNPTGFANVRAHAEAHLRALTMAAPSPGPLQ